MKTGLRKSDLPILPRGPGFAAAAGRRQDFVLAASSRGLFYAVLGLTIYGSLYPFNFSSAEVHSADFGNFLSHWRLISRRGDMLGNCALFVPFGALGMLALVPGRPPAARFVVLALIGLFVAAGVQVLQIFLPGRDAALGDVVWNLGGLTLGAALVWPAAVRDRLLSYAGVDIPLIPLGLLVCWLGSELAPFVPSMDLQALKDSVKPLLEMPQMASVDFLRSCVSWLAACFLMERLLAGPGATRLLLVAAPAIVLAKIIIIQNDVSSSYVAGLVVALTSWFAGLRGFPQRVPLLIGGLVTLLAVAALEPFTVNATAKDFSWIPFSGALSGSMLTNSRAIAGKIFLFGSLLFLAVTAGRPLALVTALTVVFAALLEVAQVRIGNHTPEITDPLIALCIGGALAVLRRADGGGRRGSPEAIPPLRQPTVAPESRAAASLPSGSRAAPSRRALLVALAACLAATVAMQIILGLPQIPYNVRELFGGEESWWRLFVFSLAGLSVGAGGALVGLLAFRSGWRSLWILPAGTFLACLVTYLLLISSVSAESLWDITGSSNTYWFVMNRHIWGSAGVWFYEAVGSRALIQAVERYVRFTALFGPAVLWIAILYAGYVRLTSPSPAGSGGAIGRALPTTLLCLLAAAPWLVIFNLVAFDFSSTDNLNELIAGQGHILYWLLILLPLNALFIVHSVRRKGMKEVAACALVLAASLPVGWLLFKNGLGSAVTKYGQVFSGADFLLGPNREELLSESVLMVRWFAVQCAAIVALALGMQTVPGPVEPAR